jgi:hypothetical protein
MTISLSKPDPDIFSLAAFYISIDAAQRCGEAIQKAHQDLYPKARNSSYVNKHIDQVKQAFSHHPWFDSETSRKNQLLRTQALRMMATMSVQ